MAAHLSMPLQRFYQTYTRAYSKVEGFRLLRAKNNAVSQVLVVYRLRLLTLAGGWWFGVCVFACGTPTPPQCLQLQFCWVLAGGNTAVVGCSRQLPTLTQQLLTMPLCLCVHICLPLLLRCTHRRETASSCSLTTPAAYTA